MSALFTLKDHLRENQLYLNRVTVASVSILLLTILLVSRLFYFQIIQHARYTTLSRNNQLKINPIPPTRGLIFDRDGQLLAGNVPAFSLEITRNKVPHLKETLTALKKLIPISEAQEQAFYKQLRYTRSSESVPIRLKLTELEVASFSVQKHQFPGVEVVAHPIRHYPFKTLFAHVIGYIGPLNEQDLTIVDKIQYRGTYHMGKTGLEKFYETELHGQIGYQQAETDAHGHMVRVRGSTPPTAGNNLYLAIDLGLQQAAFDALGTLKGAVIAIDPRNGDVLAMVSNPSFDPNAFTQGIDSDSYDKLQFSSERPLFNRVVNGLYPPASTVKTILALQGLESGLITTKTQIFDPGWYQLNGEGRKYHDWNWRRSGQGHGTVNLEKALAQSCDTYFFALANKMGAPLLLSAYQRFGLGQKTGLDFPYESPGLLPTPEWKKRVKKESWYPGDTLNIGIGQGFGLSTPLQIAQLAAILANRGQYVPPRLVIGLGAHAQTDFIENPVPTRQQITLTNPEHWEYVIEGMRKTVHVPGGTAYKISKGLQYSVAAKTGTAQVFNLKQDQKYEAHKLKSHLRDHSWFMGFAPINHPKIAIAVLVENKYQTSSAEIARQVLDHFFEQESFDSQ